MTTTEDRLRAALDARAEQVQDVDVPARVLPRAGRTSSAGWSWRIPVAAAVACATAVGVTYVALHHDRSPAPALADTPHRLTGDLDGDGRPDTVTMTAGGRVTLRLGDGRILRGSVRTPAALVGLAEIGAPDKAIVVAEEPTAADFNELGLGPRAAAAARVATVLELGEHGSLDRAVFDPQLVPPQRTPSTWFWVADGRLFGTEDRKHAGRITVPAATYSLKGGKLAPHAAGEMCWDTTSEPAPSSCRPGHDYRPSIGSRSALTPLYPENYRYVVRGRTLHGEAGGRQVEAKLSGPDRSGRSVLEVRVDGKAFHARTTAVSPPDGTLYPLLVPDQARADAFGVAAYYECCDSATVLLFSFRDGRLTQVPVANGVRFGDGFFGDAGNTSFSTWQGPSGLLFTSDARSNNGVREHVLADRLVDGTFEQRVVGWVCRDPDAPERWGRCPG